VTLKSIPGNGVPIADTILNHASDQGYDIVVMGAYGHSWMREALLGGATRDILRTMTVPVLMAH
jgi:nucleotide-binding universal stress UspA family protein